MTGPTEPPAPSTRFDLIRDAAAISLLFAASDPAALVWGSPEHWRDLLRLSPTGSTAAVVLYLACAAIARGSDGRRLTHRGSLGLLSVPAVANLLLLLTSPVLTRQLGEVATWPLTVTAVAAGIIGRALVLILINELLVCGPTWLTGRPWPRRAALHGVLAASALGVVVAPLIADAGSAANLLAIPAPLARAAAIAATAVAAMGLWGQTFLVTGAVMNALRGIPASRRSAAYGWREGAGKGAVYAACFLLVLAAADALFESSAVAAAWRLQPYLLAAALGAITFPVAKTIIETFDGNPPFVARLGAAARSRENYLRGVVLGLAVAAAATGVASTSTTAVRLAAGASIGAITYGGVDLLIDLVAIVRRKRRKLQAFRIYGFGAALGSTVGAALAWYFDAPQLAAVTSKLDTYTTIHFDPASGVEAGAYVIYPLFSKWGAIDLGFVAGGARLLFSESLSGVINWSLAAPLFGVNLVVLTAAVQRSWRPIRGLLSQEGLIGVVEQTIRVQRWGLWMAPVIYSLLRLAPDPTWYNQDGAIRTLVAIGQSIRLDPMSFRAWSLEVFLGLLAYDWLRILIWFDHMGLRVATLVNASFVVGDVVDERSARFLGHAMRSRAIPEGIRRFATWGPLLIPFYIPRGAEWDTVWSRADVVAASGQPLSPPIATVAGAYAVSAAAGLMLVAAVATLRRRGKAGAARAGEYRSREVFLLRNDGYASEIDRDGCGFSSARSVIPGLPDIDLNRRPEPTGAPRGKFHYVRELDDAGEPLGPLRSTTFAPTRTPAEVDRMFCIRPGALEIERGWPGLRIETSIRVPASEPVETRTLRIVNLEERARTFEVTTYQEIALAGRENWERHPTYHALHVATCFVRPLAAILAHNRSFRTHETRAGIEHEVFFHAVASDGHEVELVGYEDSRSLFLGAGTAELPEAIHHADFRSLEDEGTAYTFDPAASLQVRVRVGPRATATIRYVDGCARSEREAAALISESLGSRPIEEATLLRALATPRKTIDRQRRDPDRSAFEFSPDGSELRTTWDTARPWHHVIANPLGHGSVLGNDGSMYSFAANSQQNGLTPFITETIPCQRPVQALYVVDLESGRIDAPTFVPLRHHDADYEAVFGLGYGVFSCRSPGSTIEMTLFCPPADPVEIRVVRIHNRGTRRRRYRVVPYLEIALGELARDGFHSLEVEPDAGHGAIWFRRPDNPFHQGNAFLAWSLPIDAFETDPARFFGDDPRETAEPAFVRDGAGHGAPTAEGARIAALAGTVAIDAGASADVVVVIGQTPTRAAAIELLGRLANPAAAWQSLAATKAWWRERLSGLRVETDRPEFDRLVNDWLPYQTLAARLWGRTGPSQRSGGYGYRDQLQDVIPFALLEPAIARRQILLHASRQFLEGDVLQWWHTAADGRVGLGARNHASDPHLWLVYVVDRYVTTTGDVALLGERTPFLEGPVPSLKEHGEVFVPRVSRDDATVYEHCRLAVDRTLARRGAHGLPLIGRGDWNDSLDAIGAHGRGESVWLGFFLHECLLGLARLADATGHAADAGRYRADAASVAASLATAWRTDHFLRAFADDGAEVDFASALMAAWPALGSAVGFDHALIALDTGLAALEHDDMVLLLTPPLGPESRPSPGKIALYPPGVRENGGQYSHGCSWLVDALVTLADRAEQSGGVARADELRRHAYEVWRKISPLGHAAPAAIDRYGLAPHQQPADVYSDSRYRGRGGWSWYTGAAARMLGAAHALLGIEARAGAVSVRSSAATHSNEMPRLKQIWRNGERIFPE